MRVGFGGDDIDFDVSENRPVLARHLPGRNQHHGKNSPLAVWIHGGGHERSDTPLDKQASRDHAITC